MAFMVWTQPAHWGARLFIIPFVLIGLGALYFTARLQKKSVLSRGARLVLSNSTPRAGEPLQAELLLPNKRGDWLQQSSVFLHLVQYEEDRSGSSISYIRSHALEQAVRPEQLADGSWRLSTTFNVPANAPATGAVRHGNTVVWKIELHEAKQAELASFKIAMRAAKQPTQTWSDTPLQKDEAPDAYAALASSDESVASLRWPTADEGEQRFHQQEIATLDIGEQPQALARSVVHLEENTQFWRAAFPRKAWRVWAVMTACASVAALWWARGLWHADTSWGALAEGLAAWLLACALLIASMHAWTKRWHLLVLDDGFAVDKSSALFKRVQEFGANVAKPLRYALVYQTSGTGRARVWHFSATLTDGVHGRKIAITPALPGAPTCAALAHHFWQALAHRRMRFAAPGGEMPFRLGTSLTQRLSSWFVLILIAGLFLVFTTLSPKTHWIDGLKPSLITDQVRQQLQRLHPKNILLSSQRDALLQAHRANQPEQLAQILKSGVDANSLDDDGMPLLMDAVMSGHLEIVRTYLQQGADVNIRHTANPNNHGDTALLVALHRGRWEIAQLLIEAGADLSAKNRWDWGAMHMAALGDCLACLERLLALGFSPNEPAPASRGESPVMLAAGSDQLEALKWLVAHGGSLEQKDPHGQNALAWAEFFKRQKTAAWIRSQAPLLHLSPEIKN